MPVKHRVTKAKDWTISQQDIEDFRRAMEIRGDETRREEYSAIRTRLFFSFSQKLWITDLCDIDGWSPPGQEYDLADYQRAYDIRKALERAASLQKPHKRPAVRSKAKGPSRYPRAPETRHRVATEAGRVGRFDDAGQGGMKCHGGAMKFQGGPG
jgi:hypothetical protein